MIAARVAASKEKQKNQSLKANRGQVALPMVSRHATGSGLFLVSRHATGSGLFLVSRHATR